MWAFLAGIGGWIKSTLSSTASAWGPVLEQFLVFTLGKHQGATQQKAETRAENAEAELEAVKKHEQNKADVDALPAGGVFDELWRDAERRGSVKK